MNPVSVHNNLKMDMFGATTPSNRDGNGESSIFSAQEMDDCFIKVSHQERGTIKKPEQPKISARRGLRAQQHFPR
jgi:hypothetical protein